MKVYIVDSTDIEYPVDEAAIFAQSRTAIDARSIAEDGESLVMKPVRRDGTYCRREAVELVVRMIERHGSNADTYPRFNMCEDRFKTNMIAREDRDDVRTACERCIINDVISACDFLDIPTLLETVSRCTAEYFRGMSVAQIRERIKI